jgi:hypothetical protein
MVGSPKILKAEKGAQFHWNLNCRNILSISDLLMEGDMSGSMKTGAPEPRTMVV